MGVSAEDRVGSKFGKLTVLSVRREGRRTLATVSCECGVVKETRMDGLVYGATTSCGCVGMEKIYKLNKSHGMYGSPTYHVWGDMKQRCGKCKGYENITYDTKWETFEGFLEDMGVRPEGLTLDRINVAKGYFKDNCRWANASIQVKNQGKRNLGSTYSDYKGVSFDKRYKGNWLWSVTKNYITVRGSTGKDETRSAKYFNFCTLVLYDDPVKLNDVNHLDISIEEAEYLYNKLVEKFPEV